MKQDSVVPKSLIMFAISSDVGQNLDKFWWLISTDNSQGKEQENHPKHREKLVNDIPYQFEFAPSSKGHLWAKTNSSFLVPLLVFSASSQLL